MLKMTPRNIQLPQKIHKCNTGFSWNGSWKICSSTASKFYLEGFI